MLTTKITYALADWITEWRKCRNEDPSLDDCLKFVNWKIENYKISNSDQTHMLKPSTTSKQTLPANVFSVSDLKQQ